MIFVHEGSEHAGDDLRRPPVQAGDYVRRSAAARRTASSRGRAAAVPRLRDAGPDRDPAALPQASTGSSWRAHPYYHRDIPSADRGSTTVHAGTRRVYGQGACPQTATRRTSSTTTRSDVVGWDGYLYPWTFSIHDFEPITGRIHQPPPSHQTFQGQNFTVICSFCPRKLDFDPLAVPIPVPPLEPAVRGDDLLRLRRVRLAQGDRHRLDHAAPVRPPARTPAGARREVDRGCPTRRTSVFAVMCDTFHPLKLTSFARDLDDGTYWRSWYANAQDSDAAEGSRRLGCRGSASLPSRPAAPGSAAVLPRADHGTFPRLRGSIARRCGRRRGAVPGRRREWSCRRIRGGRRAASRGRAARPPRREPVVRKLLGFDFDLVEVPLRGAAGEELLPLRSSSASAAASCPTPRTGSVRDAGAGAITAQQVSLFLGGRGSRNRLVEQVRRAGSAASGRSRRASGSRRPRRRSSSRSASRGARPSTWSASRAPTSTLAVLLSSRTNT